MSSSVKLAANAADHDCDNRTSNAPAKQRQLTRAAGGLMQQHSGKPRAANDPDSGQPHWQDE
jgi:hypothetical protein